MHDLETFFTTLQHRDVKLENTDYSTLHSDVKCGDSEHQQLLNDELVDIQQYTHNQRCQIK